MLPGTMSVAVLLLQSEAERLLPWAERFARARGERLVVLRPSAEDAGFHAEDVAAEKVAEPRSTEMKLLLARLRRGRTETTGTTAAEPAAPLRVELCGLPAEDVADAVLELIARRGLGVLLLPAPKDADGPVRRIFRRASCEALILRPGRVDEAAARSVLVPLSTGANARAALRNAVALTAAEGTVTALYVEPPVAGEEESVAVGRLNLERELRRSLGASSGRVVPRVRIADDVAGGILAEIGASAYDLVLVGATEGVVKTQLTRKSVSRRLRREAQDCAVGVVRAAAPFADRLERGLARALRSAVPQLSRDERTELVAKVQSNSTFNFDFVALVCLSTLIAGLGLLRNSGAVVIGAMLVAPLMTPLVGCGLALVHGNAVLVSNAARAVLLGFLLSFGIGLALGLTGSAVTDEMLARGEPHLFDLVVAGASGLAAAYATARPGLSGALPGVAIAAALVPPIATSGIAAASGEGGLAVGAGLLFFTNIVAIVLGSAAALYALGLRTERLPDTQRRWIRPTLAGLATLLFALSVWLAWPNALRNELERTVEAHEAMLGRLRAEGAELDVWVEATEPVTAELVDAVGAVFAAHTGRADVRVRVHSELVSEGPTSPPR